MVLAIAAPCCITGIVDYKWIVIPWCGSGIGIPLACADDAVPSGRR